MLNRFMLWTFEIEPEWVGLLVYASGLVMLSLSTLAIALLLIVLIPKITLAVVLSIIGYAWVVALFFQKGN